VRALAKPAFVRSRISARSNSVLNGTKERTLGLQPLDHLQQMRQGSREAVNPHDDQRVAFADAFQHSPKHRPRAIAA
jgi:hypothetical protein